MYAVLLFVVSSFTISIKKKCDYQNVYAPFHIFVKSHQYCIVLK